jgi:hypothetical protein
MSPLLLLLFGTIALAQREKEEEEAPRPPIIHGRGGDLVPHTISVFETKQDGENIGMRNDLYKRLPDASPLNYHNGPVMTGPITIYPIFYGDWNKTKRSEEDGTFNSDTREGAGIIYTFLKLYGNGTLSERFSVNSYYGSGDAFSDTIPKSFETAPPYFVETYVLGTIINPKDVNSLVAFAVSRNAATPSNANGTWGISAEADPNGIYLVMTSSEVEEHGGFCEKYCGWHTYGSVLGMNEIKYIFVGNPSACLDACAPQKFRSPNGNVGVDAMINVIAHEIDETVTDPLLDAWYDMHGEESADKCNWHWGSSVYLGNDGAYSNLHIKNPETGRTERYLVQSQWKVDMGTSFIEQLGCVNE